MSNQVFHDPTGKRRNWVGRSLATILFALIILFGAFAATLLITPNLPNLKAQLRSSRSLALPNADRAQRAHELDAIRPHLKAKKETTKPPVTSTVTLGFLPTWEPTALDSFRNGAKHLTDVSPSWLRLGSDGVSLDRQDYELRANPNNAEIIDIARRNHVRLVPILSNAMSGAKDGVFDPVRVRKMLDSTTAQDQLATSILNFLAESQLDGINIDFEDLDEVSEKKMPAFLQLLGHRLHERGYQLSFDVQVSADQLDVKTCAEACDYLVLMVYDYSSEDGKPGPIAPLSWNVQSVSQFLKRAPADKVVLGIGSYAYDWKNGKAGANSVSYEEAISNADGYLEDKPEDAIEFDSDALNMHYRYVDDEDNSNHDVWILDAVSAFNQWESVREMGLKGAGLWALGTEDPSIWKFFDFQTLQTKIDPHVLEIIDVPRTIDFKGKGELLQVEEQPQQGERSIDIDQDSNLIVDQSYEKYPFSYVIRKSGYVPKKLVLTFDDGPDPRYTPQILDVLKDLKVPAAFFVIGQNCERYPDLVQRIYREGHELGNHSFTHPDLGTIGERQSKLEINATQRAIESLTGHRTLLFRPPYNADSQPETNNQVLPVAWASDFGYIVAGENIDPHDWSPTIADGKGGLRPHTGEDIAKEILESVLKSQAEGSEGNIILLHDAGGDRTETIRALQMFIPRLRKLGYEFGSIASLTGKSRDQVMPPLAKNENSEVTVDRVAFWVLFTFQWLLALLFIVAIGLGIVRVLFLVPLAVAHFRKRPKLEPITAPTHTLSVLIAAYNEQETIEATIRSVMKSSYPLTEVIVVDDGSSDRTNEVIQALAKEFPTLVPLTKPNGGKASALNVGIEIAKGDLLFCIDADTHLDAHAIERMVGYFDDPKIGAVAGNVEVGNVHNLITSWQAIEYRTSQNLDRQAYSALNSITVVPGAIGMWRKSAILEAGMYQTDTLAEDMDLTWRIRKLGYSIETESRALAYTEAPDTISTLFRQRFRWAFGTLQCLWKHRNALGRYGWFGRLALPTLWLFQVLFQVLAPIMDVKILFAVISALLIYSSPVPGSDTGTTYGKIVGEAAPPRITETLMPILILYGTFLALELVSGWIAYRMDRRSAWRLWGLIPQRFLYRQLMYAVVLRGLWRAMLGEPQGWGKLKRTGKVKVG